MNILGLSCHYHDSAAALLAAGQLVAAAEEERFSRKKHDAGFPRQAIDFCLRQAGLRPGDLDYVVFHEKPFVKFTRVFQTAFARWPKGWKVFRKAAQSWLGEKLWIKALIERELDCPPERVLFSEHHLSHAASAFLASPFDEAAILTVDGVGEWATAAAGFGRKGQIVLNRELRFPHSLGLLYSTFTAWLGFQVNEGEYKVMGMAAYGQPRFAEQVRRLVQVDSTGGLHLNRRYFSFIDGIGRPFSRAFVELFGPPRQPDSAFNTCLGGSPGSAEPELIRDSRHHADVAASVQQVTEEVLLRMARSVREETGLRRLCMAGGVALNGVANARILREAGFDDLYVQPASGDAGAALGAALYVWHGLLGQPRAFIMDHAYWGYRANASEIRQALRETELAGQKLDEAVLLHRVATAIADGQVVGWFQGQTEWGPRALGHRSILADPRRPDMKDQINRKIKFRESFRPFAPSVLAERAEEYFDLPNAARRWPARFMLLVVPVRPEKRAVIPAVCHQGTARPQIVFRRTNARYYDLIDRFGRLTGVPVLLNTSFNLRGEPIVNTPADAVRTFLRSELDILVMENFLVTKRLG